MKITWQKFGKITKKLQHKKNWTIDLIYVHRTRLIIGFLLGLVCGWGLK